MISDPTYPFRPAVDIEYNGSMSQTKTNATDALDALNIPYKLFIHEHPLTSIEQAAEERGLQTAQIIRSLLFRTSKEGFVMVLMPGPAQVSWSKLRHYLGISRLTTASEGEVLEMTGYERGAVSPLGLHGTIRILGDDGICEHEVVSLGAGIRNAGIIMRRDDLLQAVEIELADFKDMKG